MNRLMGLALAGLMICASAGAAMAERGAGRSGRLPGRVEQVGQTKAESSSLRIRIYRYSTRSRSFTSVVGTYDNRDEAGRVANRQLQNGVTVLCRTGTSATKPRDWVNLELTACPDPIVVRSLAEVMDKAEAKCRKPGDPLPDSVPKCILGANSGGVRQAQEQNQDPDMEGMEGVPRRSVGFRETLGSLYYLVGSLG